jgi:hypothetical protein
VGAHHSRCRRRGQPGSSCVRIDRPTEEHPALKIERESTALFDRLCESFGLNSVARVRLGLAELQRQHVVAEVIEAFGEPELRPIDSTAGGAV